MGKLSFEAEREYWWAQAGHIQELTQEASIARAQKEEAEKIEVKNMRESFLLAEAMGVSGIEEANPYRPAEQRGDSSQTVQLARFLEESIRKKESNLECPVCLEVTFIFPCNFKDIILAIFCPQVASEPIFGCSRQFHLICGSCKSKPEMTECPQCRYTATCSGYKEQENEDDYLAQVL